jgi:hypothetical protein
LTDCRTALPEAGENTIASYLAQKASSARNAEQVDASTHNQPEAADPARHPNTTTEESGPAADLQKRIIDAEDGAEQANGSAHAVAEAAPVEVDQNTTTQRTEPATSSHTTNSNNTALTPSCKSRLPKEQGTWTSDPGGYHFLTNSPTIIKLKDGSFVELRCDMCNGNSSGAHQTMNKGVRGFQSHFRQIHDDKSGIETTLQRCTHRVMTAQEVERIITGASKIDLVACKTKVSVRFRVEYVGQAETGSISVSRGGHTVESLAAAAMLAARTISRPPKSSTPKALKQPGRTRDISLQPEILTLGALSHLMLPPPFFENSENLFLDGEIMFVGAVFLQRHSGSPGGAVVLCVDEQSVHSLTPMNLGAQASEELIGYVAGSCGDESACFNWLVVGSYGVVVDARLPRDAHQPADRGRVPVARGLEPLLLCLHGGARSIGKLALP